MIHEGGACGSDMRPLRHANLDRRLARRSRCNRAPCKLREECRCRRAKSDLITVADDQTVATIQGNVAGVVGYVGPARACPGECECRFAVARVSAKKNALTSHAAAGCMNPSDAKRRKHAERGCFKKVIAKILRGAGGGFSYPSEGSPLLE